MRGKLTPERAKPAGKDELSIASYNVENLDAVNDAGAHAGDRAPDHRQPALAGHPRAERDAGHRRRGPGSARPATPTWQALVAAIAAEGGPAYEYRQIDPVHNADGGAPNANIRVGFLFNPARVQFVDRRAARR